MKKLSIIALLALTSAIATAQTYKPFRVELGITMDNSLDEEAKSGWGGYLEPRFAANDHWLFGFRFERVSLSGNNITIDFDEIEVSNTSIRNRSIFVEYFFTNDKVRPFIGMSAGLYKRGALGVEVGTNGIQIGELGESQQNFGFAPRVGINAGHFRFHANANFTGEHIADYVGFGIGLELGGGKTGRGTK